MSRRGDPQPPNGNGAHAPGTNGAARRQPGAPLSREALAGVPPTSDAWQALARATTRRALWTAMLALLRERIAFADALLAFPYEEGVPAEMCTTATPRKGAEEFHRLSADANLAVRFSDAHPEVAVAEVSEELTPVVWEQTEHFRKLFVPRGWYYSLAFFFRRRGRFFARVALSRKRAPGNFTAAERAAATALHASFAAAIERVWEIEARANAAGVLTRKLRDLPQALAVFDGAGRLKWSTRAAQAEAARWGAPSTGDGGLALPPAAARALDALRKAWRRVPFHRAESAPPPPVLCRHPEYPELHLQVSAEPPAAPGGEALFFVHFLEAGAAPVAASAPRWLALLTTGERRVAEAVCRGLTNREAATALHLSIHTVSAHLRQIFAKLDVHSRHALTARLAADSAEVFQGAELSCQSPAPRHRPSRSNPATPLRAW